MFRFIREHCRPTLAFKLGFLVLASTSLVFFVVFGYYNHVVRKLMMKGVEEKSRSLARSTVQQINSVLRTVEPLPDWIGLEMASGRPAVGYITNLIETKLRVSPQVYGSAVAFAPGIFSVSSGTAAPYVYRKNGRFQFVDLAQGDYNYQIQDWYLIPRETGKPIWTDPYFDEGGGNAMMCTYSVPFYQESSGQKIFAGVATADVLLDHMVQTVSSIKLYDTGFAMLLSQSGQFISHPRTNYIFRESVFSVAAEANRSIWRDIGRKMVRGEEGFVRTRSLSGDQIMWVYYAPIANGWSVGMLFPEAEVLGDLRTLNQMVLWIGLIGFGALLVAITTLSLSITRPIHALAEQTQMIAHGNLDLAVATVNSRDEVGLLSRSFEDMRLALREYVANLAATPAAKERIDSELKIAQTIQRSFLPKRFPPFPEHTEFDIYGELQAAKEVGGDLFDYFLLDNHRLFFSIGDVSGKGVPAALFMAVTKTLMKGVAEQHLSPSQVLKKVNHELYVDNEQMMFVTLCCGVVDLQTGEVQYSNAGHLPPLLLRPGQGGSWVDLPKGSVLGIAEESSFETRTLRLEPADTLLLYTDGVSEAMNASKELYGDDRLRNLVEGHTDMPPKTLVGMILGAIHRFAGGEEQSDDITLLAIRYRQREQSTDLSSNPTP
jgi:phosphoserine phosphatase RsbU/P